VTKRSVLVALALLLGALAPRAWRGRHARERDAGRNRRSTLRQRRFARFSEPVANPPTAIRVLAADRAVLSGEARSAAGDRS
jgi:hypothetical protein